MLPLAQVGPRSRARQPPEVDLTLTRPGPVRMLAPPGHCSRVRSRGIEPGTVFGPSELRSARAPGGQRLIDGGPMAHAAAPSSGSDSAMLVTRAIVRRPALARGYESGLVMAIARESSRIGLLLYRSDTGVRDDCSDTRFDGAAAGACDPTAVVPRSVEHPLRLARSFGGRRTAAPASQPADLPCRRTVLPSRTSSGAVRRCLSGRPRAGGPPADDAPGPALNGDAAPSAHSGAAHVGGARTRRARPDGAALHGAAGDGGWRDRLLLRRLRIDAVERPTSHVMGPFGAPMAVAVQPSGRGTAISAGGGRVASDRAASRRWRRALAGGRSGRCAELGRPRQAAKTQIDLDELVEKAWQKLMRRVTVEQERRGYTRWP